MLRFCLLCALLVVCACGPGEGTDESKPSAPAPPSAAGATEAEAAAAEPADPDDPLAGLWWVLLPTFPIRAFRVNLESGEEGETRSGTWIIFDWRATTDAEALQRRSKQVRITARGSGSELVLEGPMPMLTEAGQPNGQSGRWRIELRRSELPGEAPRWTGTAVHDDGLTGAQGIPAEMERAFRRWQ